MKTILVPTDFSGAADTALNYAVALAGKLHSRIILLHVFQVPVPVAEVSFNVLNDERRSLKTSSGKKLHALAARINHSGKISHECLTEEGEAAETVLRIANEKKTDLIVMGTTGETGLSHVIFGSTSLKVMERAQCPVMAVPEGLIISKPITRITFATDYHNSDFAAIARATEIAGATGAQLNILHICSTEIDASEEKKLMIDFMERVKKITIYPNLSFQIIHGDNVEERLEQYIEGESADMLMMATHYRSFFNRLFGKSITKNVARHATIPVVAFHYNAKTAVKLY
jgi:nucleotide-binding universal stress UspA family protein